MLAGATVLYNSRFQDKIALSSIEADFIAVAEAGKYITLLVIYSQ